MIAAGEGGSNFVFIVGIKILGGTTRVLIGQLSASFSPGGPKAYSVKGESGESADSELRRTALGQSSGCETEVVKSTP